MLYSYYAYLFHQFLLMYNITYSTPSLFMERFDIFTSNMEFVDEYNSKPTMSVTLGLGPFADQTLEEFQKSHFGLVATPPPLLSSRDSYTYTGCPVLSPNGDGNGHRVDSHNESLPSSFDWRDHRVLSSVKNQGGCGSCWAFASIEVAESVAVLDGFFDTPPIFSPKQLVDCCDANFGCSGGYIDAALQYMVSHGIVNESSYPYLPHQDECPTTESSEGPEYTPRGCFRITAESARTELSRLLMENGPLVIGIAASSSVFQLYTGGIIREWDCGTDVDHAVQLVGFGQDNESGTRYWVVRNSWGERWGEHGYFRLERTDGEGTTFPGWDVEATGTCGMMASGAWGLVS